MPLYEFTCECGKKVEKIQAFEDTPPVCCGKSMVRGCGSISMVYWNFGKTQSQRIPKGYDAKALSTAASKGRLMEYQ